MGTLYTSQSASGYNNAPPPDDGSQGSNNQITWNTTIKAKLADPIKVLADAINSQLTTVLDLSARAISSNDSAVASDHWRTLQVTGTTTITLSDAATMTNKYVVGIANLGVGTVTVGRATGADTVNGTAANFTIPPKSAVVLGVNQAANGYNIISSTGGNSNNSNLVGTTSTTTPIVDSGSTGNLSLKTNNGQTQVSIRDLGGVAANQVVLAGGITTLSVLAAADGTDSNIDFRLATKGTGSLSVFTNGTITNGALSAGVLQFQVLHTASASRNITVTGSNGGNPTIGVTAGSLAITPAVVISGASVSIGTNPASGGTLRVPYSTGEIVSRNSTNGADVSMIRTDTRNSVVNVVFVGTGGLGSSVGVLILARSGAGAPTTSDIASGEWCMWRDTSGATTKLYYNNAGSLQSVALA